jgi:Fe-S cluster assembly protein SufB
VLPVSDNFFAALNSAVFTDGSLSTCRRASAARWNVTYFRINARSTGQFERTLIIALPPT